MVNSIIFYRYFYKSKRMKMIMIILNRAFGNGHSQVSEVADITPSFAVKPVISPRDSSHGRHCTPDIGTVHLHFSGD